MSADAITDRQLLGYLDELLPVAEMTRIEQSLRESESLRRRAAAVARDRDHGGHAVGEVWRRRRLSCPSRTQLGSYLLGTLERPRADYIDFHLRTVGCRYCLANLDDLQSSLDAETAPQRRRRFFQSSAGSLPQNQP